MGILLIIILGIFVILGVITKYLMTQNPELRRKLGEASSPLTKEQTAQPQQAASYPYEKRASLLTPNEQAFFRELHPLTAPHWYVFCQVRMEDIINVKKGLDRKVAYGFRSRIKSRHIDFVLCDKETLEVLMCIELDDKSHRSAKAKESDHFKNEALATAGLTLIRIPARSNYTEDYIKPYIFEDDLNSTTVAEVISPDATKTATLQAN